MPVSLLDKNVGGAVLVVVALVSLVALLASNGRGLAEFGVVADANWLRHGLIALGVGVLGYAGYLAFGMTVGVFSLDLSHLSVSRGFKSLLAALSSLPIAATQQIIFGGLLLGTLRARCGAAFSVLVPALLFGLVATVREEGGPLGTEGSRLLIGLTLLAAVLGAVRLRTGNIVVPVGLLAGMIAVRKLVSKGNLLEFHPNVEWSPWLAPTGDPRQGPVLWGLLGGCLAAASLVLWLRGERHPRLDAKSAASFKRIMPFSNLLAFTPLDRWLALLAEARFRVGLKYFPRLVFTLIASALNTLASLPERLVAPLLLKHKVPPPVFIVGMHRSGTTHLHNLLALDRQFRSPRNYEVFNPHGFLTAWTTTLAMIPLLMWRRPMDSVRMTPFSSQEEEFALAAMGSPSPYWSFTFPQRLAEHNRYWHPREFTPQQMARWQRHYLTFLRKLTWRCRRRPLLKNPANTPRVGLLKEMFPEAKFVYIVRHPHAVYRSNVHFAEQGIVVFQLQDPLARDTYADRILENYRSVSEACERELDQLPRNDVARLRFEDLEANPVAEIERLYRQLGLELTGEFRQRMEEYLTANAGYTKNRFATLPDEERAKVDAAMGAFAERWGYTERTVRRAA